ncbi:uncharacterized protein LOC116350696 isoform X1 [Contarinia nasturtii]|uniref:uncharacterized protein LOC116350696 isoform X1 n=1 Tax=Contarinia nasturtii TaxID=265458 RepID=UPI0012D43694|nr:uncharacterized protein LOC116350696 isoform X1 [Contarinia nasturtii]
MACSRSPPASPRAPKIQQQIWDDCATPPVGLFDPNKLRKSTRDSPKSRSIHSSSQDDSPKLYRDQRSPKSPQKFTYGPKVAEPQYFSLEEPPRSPKITYSTPSPTSSKMADISGNVSPSSGYFEQRSPKYLSHQSSPRKFVFDAVSPRRESIASKSGFSVAKPNDVVDMHEFDTTPPNSPYKFPSSMSHSIKLKRQSSLHYKRSQQYHQPQQHSHRQSPNFDLIKQSSDPLHSTFVTDFPSNVRKQQQQQQKQIAAPPPSQQLQHQHQQQQHQQQQQRRQSISNEASSEISAATTALCCESTTTTDTSRQSSSDWRRQAMHITSNPNYQALHTSHSTLDRTCSDSVMMSSCCRKSTSDLTSVTESNIGAPVASHHRRRGSSKGGLALLASRRNSRDSIKSAASNSSLFSNEDVGPLAFQASARGRQRRTSNFLELPVPDHQRPRVCSLPDRPYNPRQSDDLYRLRTFSISKGTVVNCGDSIISRRSRSNTSVNSTTSRASERSPFEGSCCGKGYTAVDDSLPPSPTESAEIPPPPRYRVVLFGDAGTGKTALVSQFMTSEYMHTYDASLDDEFGEKTVSVLLDGEESEIVFIDHPSSEMSVENSLSTYEPHGCVIVYSVVQRSSFRQAEEIVKYLWRENVTKEKSVILVGNKADLARSRVIPTAEGKALAKSIEAKFIETSSGIQHNVDELLVGILKQIRLKETRDKKAAAQNAMKMRNSRTHINFTLAKEILQKICLSDITKSRSCENLHVL